MFQKPVNVSEDDYTPVCSYYNFSRSDWSTEGCQILEQDNSSVTCQCDHLTNFAILMVRYLPMYVLMCWSKMADNTKLLCS